MFLLTTPNGSPTIQSDTGQQLQFLFVMLFIITNVNTLQIYINCLTHQGQVCPRTVAPHPSPPDALLLRRGL